MDDIDTGIVLAIAGLALTVLTFVIGPHLPTWLCALAFCCGLATVGLAGIIVWDKGNDL